MIPEASSCVSSAVSITLTISENVFAVRYAFKEDVDTDLIPPYGSGSFGGY